MLLHHVTRVQENEPHAANISWNCDYCSIQHPAGGQYSQILVSVDQQMPVFHLETLIPVSTRPGRIHDCLSAICGFKLQMAMRQLQLNEGANS